MIDVENIVIESVNTAIHNGFSTSLDVSGEDLPINAEFPYVYLVEADNYNHENSMDSSNEEKYAKVMYEVKVYSNKKGGRKTEAKKLFSVIDGVFRKMGFIRKSTTRTPIYDGTVYVIIGRYEAVVSNENKIFWR